MSANLVANVSVSGTLTGANITTSRVRILTNPETLTASGAMNPYRPSVLRPVGASGSLAMTLPNLGASVTNIITKPIYVKSGFSTTITENSNVFTVPASANVAMATWTTDRWVVTYQ